jgi:hypothetical protein
LPETIKSGKNMEKTQPETTRLDGQLVITASGRPNPERNNKAQLVHAACILDGTKLTLITPKVFG